MTKRGYYFATVLTVIYGIFLVVHWKKVKLWEGVKREVHEETGLDVEVEQLAGIYYTPRQNQIAFSYFCSIIGGKLMVNEESDAFKYFALVEIPENFPPRHRSRIKDALENPNELIMKVQDEPSVSELNEEGKLGCSY
jgi:hypothetical protein